MRCRVGRRAWRCWRRTRSTRPCGARPGAARARRSCGTSRSRTSPTAIAFVDRVAQAAEEAGPPPRHPRPRVEQGPADAVDPQRGRDHGGRPRPRPASSTRSHDATASLLACRGRSGACQTTSLEVAAPQPPADDRDLPRRGRPARLRQRVLRRGRVRARPLPPRAARGAPGRAGTAGRRAALHQLNDLSQYLSACQFGITLAALGIGFLGEPAIAKLVEPLFGDALARRRRGDLVRHRLRAGHLAAHHRGRAGPEDLRDRQGRARSRCGSRGRSASSSAGCARSSRRSTRSSNWILRRIGIDPDAEFEEGGTPEELRAADRPGAQRRPARPGRGRDARGRLPPPRAGGAPGHDARSRPW